MPNPSTLSLARLIRAIRCTTSPEFDPPNSLADILFANLLTAPVLIPNDLNTKRTKRGDKLRRVMNSTSMSPLVVAQRLEFVNSFSRDALDYADYQRAFVRQGIEVLRALGGK